MAGAIAGLKTKQGAAYFQVRDGKTSFTPEGTAELRAEQPLIADLTADPAADVAGNGKAGVGVPGTIVYLDRWNKKYGSIYSGRLYQEKSGEYTTEILTVDLERLHGNPLLFLLNDPEYFEFVVRTLNPQ